jgi:hypothetical protein
MTAAVDILIANEFIFRHHNNRLNRLAYQDDGTRRKEFVTQSIYVNES